jgi:predicted choloylglycine hydrolase
MRKRFVALREDVPGAAWLARFTAGRSEAEAWYRGSGREAPPTAAACEAALRRHMPELLAPYRHACALVGDDDAAHRLLSQYRPAPTMPGCTQAVWLGEHGPALVRNYDFSLAIVSDHFESTSWLGREVIAKGQRPWGGCLDGMNADGLVASVTFGGDPAQGLGFSVILILRYVLETCSRVGEAVEALCRIPVALAQNVTVLDKSGAYKTVFLGPGRAPAVLTIPVCANHQDLSTALAVPANAAGSVARQQTALRILEDPGTTLATLTAAFLTAPLHSRRAAAPTVYSAVYLPGELRVDYLWPGKALSQRIGAFEPGEYVHDFGVLQD